MYQWFVFAHLVGLVLFAFAHGTSAFLTYRIRSLRDPEVVAGNLALSQQATRVSSLGLLLLLIGGAGAATSAGLWSKPWVWASVIVLVVVIVVMYAVGATYYYRLRDRLAGKGGAPIGADDLAVYLDSRRPDILAFVGGVGLLIITWLMVMKPS